jgi:hypothetical protein
MSPANHRAHLNVALMAGVAVFVCAWLAHTPGMAEGLVYLAPAVFVFALLWLGRYPGEKAILALTQLAHHRRPRNRSTPPPRPVRSYMPRGGNLLATALAGRAPPLRTRPQ